ncbi:MAG: hypothetical protein P4L50_19955 [Anaerolineaceae bacterium]|nr:hypothetical protein [Anaerolineaceae bacterium]
MNIKRDLIYIRLLGEGTLVYRPTQGLKIGGLIFKVLPTENYNPEDENWEFPPGTIVRCQKENKGGKEILVAVEEQ